MKYCIFCLLFFIIFSADAKKVSSPYAGKVKRTSSGEVYVRISSERQRGETCNPTSMSMILDHFGIYVSAGDLQEDSTGDAYKYSSYLKEQAKKYKLKMLFVPMFKEQQNISFEVLVRAIDCGVPVQWIIHMLKAPDYDVSKKHKRQIMKQGGSDGHARIIHGYRKNRRSGKLENFIFTDPWGVRHRKKDIKIADIADMTMGFFLFIPEKTPEKVIAYIYEPCLKIINK